MFGNIFYLILFKNNTAWFYLSKANDSSSNIRYTCISEHIIPVSYLVFFSLPQFPQQLIWTWHCVALLLQDKTNALSMTFQDMWDQGLVDLEFDVRMLPWWWCVSDICPFVHCAQSLSKYSSKWPWQLQLLFFTAIAIKEIRVGREGLWLCGRTSAWHAWGPRFNPWHIHLKRNR